VLQYVKQEDGTQATSQNYKQQHLYTYIDYAVFLLHNQNLTKNTSWQKESFNSHGMKKCMQCAYC